MLKLLKILEIGLSSGKVPFSVFYLNRCKEEKSNQHEDQNETMLGKLPRENLH